ncbi:MAG: alcohol dehydrogenase catalytic domain-containing protein, partial [Chloroflexi bacterium]|nr:alcohol dehydrogenase catalytic domain-containing protein [Chloroflexota bacterium]
MLGNKGLPQMMRAAMLHAPCTLSIERVPVPSCQAHEVLIEVETVGLCGSDVHFFTGERPLDGPMVLGHEIAGRIVASGSDVSLERT